MDYRHIVKHFGRKVHGRLLVAGCKSPDERIAPFADAWGVGDFAQAEVEIDALVAEEAGVAPKLVTESRGLDEAIVPARGDTFLFLQEKFPNALPKQRAELIDLSERRRASAAAAVAE